MGGEAEVLSTLTLLVAVCEQSLRALKQVSPPAIETVELVEGLRAHIYELLSSGRFKQAG